MSKNKPAPHVSKERNEPKTVTLWSKIKKKKWAYIYGILIGSGIVLAAYVDLRQSGTDDVIEENRKLQLEIDLRDSELTDAKTEYDQAFFLSRNLIILEAVNASPEKLQQMDKDCIGFLKD